MQKFFFSKAPFLGFMWDLTYTASIFPKKNIQIYRSTSILQHVPCGSFPSVISSFFGNVQVLVCRLSTTLTTDLDVSWEARKPLPGCGWFFFSKGLCGFKSLFFRCYGLLVAVGVYHVFFPNCATKIKMAGENFHQLPHFVSMSWNWKKGGFWQKASLVVVMGIGLESQFGLPWGSSKTVRKVEAGEVFEASRPSTGVVPIWVDDCMISYISLYVSNILYYIPNSLW